MRMTTRRSFLQVPRGGLCFTGAAGLRAVRAPRFARNPFALGVASGYPHPSGMVLWTRLVGALDPVPYPVRWEVASDESMRTIVASGGAIAEPAWAHSVHVEPTGLEPDRWYWYRFMAGDAVDARSAARAPRRGWMPRWNACVSPSPPASSTSRATTPRTATSPPTRRTWWRSSATTSTNPPGAGTRCARTKRASPTRWSEYRQRYALYKSDPDLQAAHAACPWIVTWDDHEVDNDYADDRPEDGMEKDQFLLRRAAAYQAYYEHMPLPERMRPKGPDMRIYTQLGWGQLARFYVLDDRQYRSWQSCPRPKRTRRLEHRGHRAMRAPVQPEPLDARARAGEVAGEFARPSRKSRWNVIAQQTTMAQFDQKPGPGRRAWTDGWDGYPASRQRLLEHLVKERIANPVVLGGDVHSFNVADLKLDFDDPKSPVVASEFVGTSVTSQAWPQERLNTFLPDNPHMKLVDSRYRGYVRVEVTPGRMRADLRALESVQARDAACSTLATFVVEDGKAGAVRL